MSTTKQACVVGGVTLPRPFKVRRLGHFGINVHDPEVSRHFYEKLLGFRISDVLDFGGRLPEEEMAKHGPHVGYFARHGTEHHSFVFFPRRVLNAVYGFPADYPEVVTNQITWQVGSLREVVDGHDWFVKKEMRIQRSGRDLPGSNWNVYPFDPDGHVNELYYGIEQVGWNGQSKPYSMHKVRYTRPPDLPHPSEYAEVQACVREGIDGSTGWQQHEAMPETWNVDGVLLGRPYKVTRVGPVRLFVQDMEQSLRFYRDELGLMITEEVVWNGHRCVFLRANTEHHSLALYPMALRAELGLNPHATLFSFGMQVANYQQLRDAVAFLKDQGVTIRMLPPELFPGIDYCAFALDPDGFAIQLYYYMEQVGWDGRPRPAALRPVIDPQDWPETVPAASDSFLGETYLGPWS